MEIVYLRKRQGMAARAVAAVGQRFQTYEWDPERKVDLHSVEIFKYLDRGWSTTTATRQPSGAISREHRPSGGDCKR